MKNSFKKSIVLFVVSVWTLWLNAQQVSITGVVPFIEPGCEYQFNANLDQIPSNWTVEDYEWQAESIGALGNKRYVSGFNSNNTPIILSTSSSSPVIAKTTQFWVVWDGSAAPSQVKVSIKIRYRIPNNPNIQVSSAFNTAQMTVKGVPANVNLSGPQTVQRCCPSAVTYTVVNSSFGNQFDQWTFPQGWVVSSQVNNSITLIPDASSVGTVTCRVRLVSPCTTIARTVSIAVNRVDATVSVVNNTFPLLRICPNTSYTYQINPVCGASSYSWQFPAGWNIISGGTTTTVTVLTGPVPQSGNITASANFNGCSSVSVSRAVTPLNGIPATPQFNFLRKNSRCGHFYICRSGGQIENFVPIDAQSYTYSVTAPWLLTNASGQQVSTVTLSFDQPPPIISLPANATPGMGTYTVTANNCFGSSASISTIFFPESDCYCTGVLINPFQDGVINPCIGTPNCGDPGDITPFRLAESANNGTGQTMPENVIYPNPTTGEVFIDTRYFDPAAPVLVQLLLADGRVVLEENTTADEAAAKLSNAISQLPGGIFIIRLQNDAVNYQQRIVKSE
ncbi:MAG: T9SS type A sorting domain-containing protein [Bacteroidia bacterium]|nr:T9SS type A sorting domain-containing protein [Bacteroidia bacterium]